jgi:hypothetical protein
MVREGTRSYHKSLLSILRILIPTSLHAWHPSESNLWPLSTEPSYTSAPTASAQRMARSTSLAATAGAGHPLSLRRADAPGPFLGAMSFRERQVSMRQDLPPAASRRVQPGETARRTPPRPRDPSRQLRPSHQWRYPIRPRRTRARVEHFHRCRSTMYPLAGVAVSRECITHSEMNERRG